jgi:hypothetical protein
MRRQFLVSFATIWKFSGARATKAASTGITWGPTYK